MQNAFATAMERWPSDGVPDNPGAWITRVARNDAIDRLRRDGTLARKRGALEQLARDDAARGEEGDDGDDFPDDRLRLIFTCCHPALAPEARVALTLRSLGGLTTAEIARAFLSSEAAMAKRLTRARLKIRDAGIRYEVPAGERMPERLPSVLATIYLIFNEGYLGTSSAELLREELCAEAIRLGALLAAMLAGQTEAIALLALMELTHARRGGRVGPSGELVLLADQDRRLWDRRAIERGLALAGRARSAGPAGPYTVQAAIAAEHATAERAEDTDWARIARLYAWLAAFDPSPVVELNHAVALAEAQGAESGLELIATIEGLDGYQPLHAARADLLRRLGRDEQARAAYRAARWSSARTPSRSSSCGEGCGSWGVRRRWAVDRRRGWGSPSFGIAGRGSAPSRGHRRPRGVRETTYVVCVTPVDVRLAAARTPYPRRAASG